MDPELLAQLRKRVEQNWMPVDSNVEAIAGLLADRDYQERERKSAEAGRDYLARLTGSAICRATCIAPGEVVIEHDPAIAGHALTGAVERLRFRAEQAESQVSRLRARLRVEAEDVERAGVTDAHAMRYVLAHGWTHGHRYRRGEVDIVVMCLDGEPIAALREHGEPNNEARASIAFIVGRLAKHENRSPWDILDEMAAMPPEAAPR